MLNNKIRNPFPMIGKVFKYEFKSGNKTLVPVYGIMMVLALLVRIFLSDSLENLTPDGVKITLGLLLFVTFFAAFILTIVFIEKRFKKGMLEDEAYLNLSLPATMAEHIVGRLLTFSVWFLMYAVASFISTFIIISGELFSELSAADFGEFFQRFYEEFGVHFGSFMGTGTVYGLSIMLLIIMFIMVVNAISHLIKKNRTIVELVVVVAFLIIFGNITKVVVGAGIDFSIIETSIEAVHTFYQIIWRMIILNFVTVVIDVIATQAILKFRLNLE